MAKWRLQTLSFKSVTYKNREMELFHPPEKSAKSHRWVKFGVEKSTFGGLHAKFHLALVVGASNSFGPVVQKKSKTSTLTRGF